MTELATQAGRVDARRAQVRAFMEEHVYPNEAALAREDESSDALIAELRSEGEGGRDLGSAPARRRRAAPAPASWSTRS